MISSNVTGLLPAGAIRSAGADSTAPASDAHEARIARFSFRVRSGSRNTSVGCANAPAGCSSACGSKSVSETRSGFCLSALLKRIVMTVLLNVHQGGSPRRAAHEPPPNQATDRLPRRRERVRRSLLWSTCSCRRFGRSQSAAASSPPECAGLDRSAADRSRTRLPRLLRDLPG